MAEDTAQNQDSKPKSQGDKKINPIWYFAAIVILLIAAGIGAYWWRDQSAKEAKQQFEQRIGELEQQVEKLQQEAADEDEAAEEEATGPSAEDLENIQAAVESGNYAALVSYMANPVTLILAASECCGSTTPDKAADDMSYADNGTAPWDWNVPAATIDSYRAGFYVDHFPEGVLVGKAANDFVIAFSFNDAGKITNIFMAINEDILL